MFEEYFHINGVAAIKYSLDASAFFEFWKNGKFYDPFKKAT